MKYIGNLMYETNSIVYETENYTEELAPSSTSKLNLLSAKFPKKLFFAK